MNRGAASASIFVMTMFFACSPEQAAGDPEDVPPPVGDTGWSGGTDVGEPCAYTVRQPWDTYGGSEGLTWAELLALYPGTGSASGTSEPGGLAMEVTWTLTQDTTVPEPAVSVHGYGTEEGACWEYVAFPTRVTLEASDGSFELDAQMTSYFDDHDPLQQLSVRQHLPPSQNGSVWESDTLLGENEAFLGLYVSLDLTLAGDLSGSVTAQYGDPADVAASRFEVVLTISSAAEVGP